MRDDLFFEECIVVKLRSQEDLLLSCTQKPYLLIKLFFFFMDFILEENAHGLALKFSQNHGNLENYKHGTVK